MDTMTGANTILEQMGGRRFVAMTGASNFLGTADSLHFKLGRFAGVKVTHVVIQLDASDTYTVRFLSVRGLSIKTISEHAGIYADGLQALFTAQTGLDTRL